MKLFVYPYTTGSESAKLLAERLGALRIKLSNSTYQHDPVNNLVINWGNSNCPLSGNVLNPADKIVQTVDKLKFFRLMMQSGMAGYVPVYWTHKDDIPDEAFPVMCRTTTTGCDGAGIIVADKRSELAAAPLYTKLIKNAAEYRVTLFRGTVTDIQTKLPRNNVEQVHPYIRTYANGWGFQRRDVPLAVKEKIQAAAAAALRVSGLDFAGVDVIFADGRAYVLEVNTAMGLEGDALERFAKEIERYAGTLTPPTPAVSNEVANLASPLNITADLEAALAKQEWLKVAKLALELA